MQPPPDRDAVGHDAMSVAQFDHQLVKGQVALFRDPAFNPTRYARQLAVPAAVALGLGRKRPSPALQQHHVVHKFDRNPELRRRSPMRVTFLNEINNPLTKLHRKWLTHQ